MVPPVVPFRGGKIFVAAGRALLPLRVPVFSGERGWELQSLATHSRCTCTHRTAPHRTAPHRTHTYPKRFIPVPVNHIGMVFKRNGGPVSKRAEPRGEVPAARRRRAKHAGSIHPLSARCEMMVGQTVGGIGRCRALRDLLLSHWSCSCSRTRWGRA